MQQRIQRTTNLVVGRLVRLATTVLSHNAYIVVLHNVLIGLSNCSAKCITRAGSLLLGYCTGISNPPTCFCLQTLTDFDASYQAVG